jgi:hypothetical protein
LPAVRGAGSAESAEGVQQEPQPKTQWNTPAAGSAPAKPQRADEFDNAALRRRKEPSALGALVGFPFDRLVTAATRLARKRLEEPRLQHLEVTVAEGVPALKVSFHDAGFERWFAVRLLQSGDVLWQAVELAGPGTPRWPMAYDLSAIEVRLSDLLDYLKEQLPDARFDFIGLQVCDGRRLVWVAQNCQAFEREPLVQVDAQNGEARLFLFDRAAGRHQPA